MLRRRSTNQKIDRKLETRMPFKRILCGVDFSEPSLRALRAAVELARQAKAALHVLHVIEAQPVVPGWLPANGLSEVTLIIEEKATAAMQSLIKSSSRELKGLKVTNERIPSGLRLRPSSLRRRRSKLSLDPT
jgi:nucleotide-binding universal stress UspA family protein